MSFLKDVLKSETRCANLPVATPSTQNIEDNGEDDCSPLSVLECVCLCAFSQSELKGFKYRCSAATRRTKKEKITARSLKLNYEK
jgi:hypothetical protein